jgi:hypothetical protein
MLKNRSMPKNIKSQINVFFPKNIGGSNFKFSINQSLFNWKGKPTKIKKQVTKLSYKISKSRT